LPDCLLLFIVAASSPRCCCSLMADCHVIKCHLPFVIAVVTPLLHCYYYHCHCPVSSYAPPYIVVVRPSKSLSRFHPVDITLSKSLPPPQAVATASGKSPAPPGIAVTRPPSHCCASLCPGKLLPCHPLLLSSSSCSFLVMRKFLAGGQDYFGNSWEFEIFM
jgi:hypothetical protein